MNARDDLDGDDRRDHQVDHETERRPPPCVADKLSPVLPEVLESVAGKADDISPAPGSRITVGLPEPLQLRCRLCPPTSIN